MLPLELARDQIRNKCSQLRAVQRISETKDFAVAFSRADSIHRAKLIAISNAKDLRVWIALAMGSPLSSLSYRKLRDMAKAENVFNYSRLSRDDLVTELEARRDRKLDTSKQTNSRTEAPLTEVRGA